KPLGSHWRNLSIRSPAQYASCPDRSDNCIRVVLALLRAGTGIRRFTLCLSRLGQRSLLELCCLRTGARLPQATGGGGFLSARQACETGKRTPPEVSDHLHSGACICQGPLRHRSRGAAPALG